MISKSKIKLIRSLSNKKAREENQLFIVEGSKIVIEVLSNLMKVSYLFATEKWLKNNDQYTDNVENVVETNSSDIKKVSNLVTPPEVLALVKLNRPMYDTTVFQNDICLVLEKVQDPGNVGTIIRIADWFGIRNIFCSNDSADNFNPKVIQSSMGSFVRENIYKVDVHSLLEDYLSFGNQNIYGTFLQGENIYKKDLSREGLIIMGNESKGISPNIEQLINHKIKVPSYPVSSNETDSLNVAIASALVCGEFRRRI